MARGNFFFLYFFTPLLTELSKRRVLKFPCECLKTLNMTEFHNEGKKETVLIKTNQMKVLTVVRALKS